MEEFTEVTVQQESSAVAEQPMPSPRGEGGPLAVDEVSEAAENTEPQTEEVMHYETEIPEATQTGSEDGAAVSNGEESQEAEYPAINPQVFAGWQELAREHPEVVGKPLPDDIMQACMQSDLPPLRVYESMMLKKQGEEIAALKEEIATLRQNADSAARAPVTAASTGGNAGNNPNDQFMLGFNDI